MDIKEFENIKNIIKNGELLKVRSEERLSYLRKSYEEKINEIKALGYNPNDLEEEIKKDEEEINEKIKKISELLPIDIIEKYKDYDFSSESEEEPNLNKDF